MTLRTRLIVAFLLLSVVPLGIVTFYSYTTNVDAMRDVAAREADLLAAVLNQRMQVITSQLSDRIEHLIDVSAPPPAPVPAPAPTTTRAVTQPASPTPDAAPPTTTAALDKAARDQDQLNHRVADALGEAAVLLNTVNVQSFGRGFETMGRLGGSSSGTAPGGARGAVPFQRGTPGRSDQPAGAGPKPPRTPAVPQTALNMPAGADANKPGTYIVRPPSTTGGRGANANAPPGAPPPPPSAVTSSASGGAGGRTNPGRVPVIPPSVPPGAPPNVTPPTPPSVPTGGATGDPRMVVATENGMTIDLTQIRRDIYRQILPSQKAETLTPEERQRVAREVNQRMLGIVEGIKLSAAEIEKKAEEARRDAITSSKEAAKSSAAAKTKTGTPSTPASSSSGSPAAPPAAAPAPAASAPAPAAAPASPSASTGREPASTNTTSATSSRPLPPLKRTAEFTGNRLDVKFERDGQVVRTVNAEINLPNMLMTVFSSTPREQGEVPFAVDKDGKVYAQTDDDKKRVEEFGAVATPTGPIGKTVLPEWIVVTTAGPTGTGLRFGIARPTGDSLAALRRTAGRNALFGLLFIGVALVGIVPLSSRLTRNLSKLTEGVSRISSGDYGARVELPPNDELGTLATAFNRMAADVEKHQRSAVEQERIKRELELGRQIQHDMLPHGALRFGLTDIKGISVPAREVGGDFFNYFQLPTGHIAMLVGDVSGKGVGAALLMANIQASLRTRLAMGQDLAAVAEEIDRDIDENAHESLYATLFVGTLEPATRILRYVNCGHNPQFLVRKNGGLERMSSTGLPVGLLAGRGYHQMEEQLEAGDRLFFYTDGCVEAENEEGDFFGPDRLEAAIAAGGDDPDETLAHVERAVEQFRGSRELLDDVTVMAVRVG